MKKVFFSGVTLVIALVAVFATRANSAIQPYYYLNPNLPVAQRCVFVNENTLCQESVTTACTYSTTPYQIFKEKRTSDNACITPLYLPEAK